MQWFMRTPGDDVKISKQSSNFKDCIKTEKFHHVAVYKIEDCPSGFETNRGSFLLKLYILFFGD